MSQTGSRTGVSAGVVLATLLAVTLLGGGATRVLPSQTSAPPSAAARSSGPAPSPYALARSEPVRLDIPAIDVHAPVGRIGLTPQETIEVPPLDRPGETGWYVYGPTPGELGPAVILGHVDTSSGPAVFFRLRELEQGDAIQVTRLDGTTATFRTIAVEQVPKANFPTERVYGSLDHAGLRLVTCGGEFDLRERTYRDNVIVFALLVPDGHR